MPTGPEHVVVTLVVTQLGMGGTEKQVRLLAQGLAAAGHDVEVLALFAGGVNADALRHSRVPVRVLGWVRTPAGALRTLVGLVQLWRHLRRRRPDVVHAFLFEAYVLVPVFARAAGVPLVVGARRSLGEYKAGRRAALLLERVTGRFQDVVIANSHAVAADVAAGEGLDPSRVTVIHNALEALPEASAVALPADGPHVLSIANLHSYKGHADLVAAAALLGKRGRDVHLVFAGDGPCREVLARQAALTGVRVTFLGQVPDVGGILSACDVFVLASWHEGMSNALMEAVASGAAVVATDVGGNREVVGDAGLLCAPRSPADLADAIERLLGDADLCERLRHAALERARAWSVEAMTQAHLRLYTQPARSRGPIRSRAHVRH